MRNFGRSIGSKGWMPEAHLHGGDKAAVGCGCVFGCGCVLRLSFQCGRWSPSGIANS